MTLDSTSFTSKTASSSKREVHLTDDKLRVTKPNSRIEIYETYRKDNPINRPIQVFYTDEQRTKKKSIPVALVRGLWHRIEISRQERTTILAEPLPSIHDFDFEIRTDQQMLDLSSIANALPTPTESTTTLPTKSTTPHIPKATQEDNDENEHIVDLLDQQIRHSPISPTISLPPHSRSISSLHSTTPPNTMTTMAVTST